MNNPAENRTYGVTDRLNRPGWYWPCALALTAFYVASSLYISSRRLLWHDEVYTAIMSRLPDMRTIWKALSEGVEQTPPLYFLITHIFDRLFSHADIGARVPSVLALGVGFLVIFDLVRRLTDGLYGLIAMCLVANSFVIYYGHEARPYAIYFMLASISLWLWTATKDESKIAAAAFGALFFIGIPVHYYFILCLVPFGLLALGQRRPFHPKVVAAAAGVTCSLVLLYPQIAGSLGAVRGGNLTSWAPPSMEALRNIYFEFFPAMVIPLVTIAAGVAIFGRPREYLVSSMTSGERIGWLFLTIPLASYAAAKLVTNFMYNRYVIGAVPGIVVAVTCLLWRYCRGSRGLSLAFLTVFAGSGIARQALALSHIDHIQAFGDYQELTRQVLDVQETLQHEGKQHIVMTSNLLFLEAWYYSKQPAQFEYITTPEGWLLGKYAPLSFVSVEQIIANARETAIISPPRSLVEKLERAGIHTRVRFSTPQYVVYLEPLNQ